MTIDEIVTLIQAVSDNGLTSFEYEEGDQKLVLKKKKKKNIAQAPVAPVVISQPAAPMMSPVPMPVAAAPAPASAGGQSVDAPMPGKILDIKVKAGDAVSFGQCVVVMEAMKMETEIVAPAAGTVASVNVSVGDAVDTGAVLVTLN